MLCPNESRKSPQTPPRKAIQISGKESSVCDDGSQQEFVNALNTPVTESRKSINILESLSTTVNNTDQEDEWFTEVPMTPLLTPQKKQKGRKYQKGHISKSSHSSRLPGPPEAVSPILLRSLSGSKMDRYIPTTKIRPISLGLQLSLAQEELSSEENTSEANCDSQLVPHNESIQSEDQISTPKGKLIDEHLANAWHGKSFNNDFLSDDELSDHENMMLKNGILESNSNRPVKNRRQQIRNSFGSAPFNLNTKTNIFTSPAIDYSTHAEYYNNKTGERIVRELTEDEKRIKPKKLNFISTTEDNDQIINEPQPPKNDATSQETSVGDKFVLNNLNRFMVDSKSKNSLDFEIFKDSGN